MSFFFSQTIKLFKKYFSLYFSLTDEPTICQIKICKGVKMERVGLSGKWEIPTLSYVEMTLCLA